MNTLSSLIFMLALAAMALVYPMYFIELSAFGKVLVRDHPDLVKQQCLSFNDSYKLLQAVKAGQLGNAALSADVLLAHSRAKKLLYIGMLLFMVVLFIGLTDAVVSNSGGQA
jgi:hypothetical protein